jgi:hypothetical protein
LAQKNDVLEEKIRDLNQALEKKVKEMRKYD